tara:strand:+ start:152 stop:499 length:348 start_codon:yes stop_codon:yes gene_type:complete
MRKQVRTGSLFNNLYQDTKSNEPVVGMGATILRWTDRTACTVARVVTPKTIEVTPDKATRTDDHGRSDAQSYEYETDPDAGAYRVTLRKDGRWKISGTQTVVLLGVRRHYHDYSF